MKALLDRKARKTSSDGLIKRIKFRQADVNRNLEREEKPTYKFRDNYVALSQQYSPAQIKQMQEGFVEDLISYLFSHCPAVIAVLLKDLLEDHDKLMNNTDVDNLPAVYCKGRQIRTGFGTSPDQLHSSLEERLDTIIDMQMKVASQKSYVANYFNDVVSSLGYRDDFIRVFPACIEDEVDRISNVHNFPSRMVKPHAQENEFADHFNKIHNKAHSYIGYQMMMK